MPTITKIDKPTLRNLQAKIVAALIPITQETGVSFKFRGGKFSNVMATLKLELFVPSQAGDTPERAEFRTYARLHGLAITDLDREVTVRGRQYTVHGLNLSRRSAYPILLRRVDNGKVFLFKSDDVRMALARNVPAASVAA